MLPVADLIEPARPILTHLNADTSWLISLPRPKTCSIEGNKHRRKYFHIILDPWLAGEIVETFRWFMTLNHSISPSFQTMNGVRQYIKQIEIAASSDTSTHDDGEADLIIVSHYLNDHCYRDSLVQCANTIPVITVETAKVLKYDHFDSVEIMPEVDLDRPEDLWRGESTLKGLPNYLRVGRLPSGERFPGLHFATLIAYAGMDEPFNTGTPVAELILYTPHGFYESRLQKLTGVEQSGKSQTLAVLHGLDPSWYPQQANLGVQNGWEVAVKMNAKYWIPTHDEHLVHTGLNGYLQTKHKKEWSDVQRAEDAEGTGLRCRELGNGESFVLV